MTGFIRGLFGGSKKDKEVAPKPPKQEKAFFLSEDDAKSFGDIDYMRTAKTVRRTYAKKKGVAEELEKVRQISSLGSTDVNKNGQPATDFSQAGQSQGMADTAGQTFQRQRRQPDSSMDTFRNMARDLKK
ncbi:MAG: hypothetical protein HC839_07075 [Leptolyngbyaceae cyanobacterium RM2_2_21]|nr:hypothetical protein [Leptolyngbyaceae cyanobacterium RM2_2_21]